ARPTSGAPIAAAGSGAGLRRLVAGGEELPMKIGVFTVLFGRLPFEEMLDYVKAAGCVAVEIGVGGFPGNAHADAAMLLEDDAARKRFLDAVTSRGLEISALSCHGNPLHPNTEAAARDDRDFRNAVRLAQRLGVSTV